MAFLDDKSPARSSSVGKSCLAHCSSASALYSSAPGRSPSAPVSYSLAPGLSSSVGKSCLARCSSAPVLYSSAPGRSSSPPVSYSLAPGRSSSVGKSCLASCSSAPALYSSSPGRSSSALARSSAPARSSSAADKEKPPGSPSQASSLAGHGSSLHKHSQTTGSKVLLGETRGPRLELMNDDQYYLVYQHQQFGYDYIGLPLFYSPEGWVRTFIDNSPPLITFNLDFPPLLNGSKQFQQVVFYDSKCNYDGSVVTLAPPHMLSMNKAMYYVPWSSLVWFRDGIICPHTVTLLLGQRRPAVERIVTARWMYDQNATVEILKDYFGRSGFSLHEVKILEPGLGYLLFESDYAVSNLMYGREETEYSLGDSSGTIQLAKPENLYLTFDAANQYVVTPDDLQKYFSSEKFIPLCIRLQSVAEHQQPICAYVSLERSAGVRYLGKNWEDSMRRFYVGGKQKKCVLVKAYQCLNHT